MLLHELSPALIEILELEWRGHFDDGLIRLRSTPSGPVRRACDLLLDKRGVWDLNFVLRLSRGETSVEERTAFFQATERRKQFSVTLLEEQRFAMDVLPVNELRTAIPFLIDAISDEATCSYLRHEFSLIRDITYPKASILRQTLFPFLKTKFGGIPRSSGGDEYTMQLLQDDTPLVLWFDLGSRPPPRLRWGISMHLVTEKSYPFYWSYEAVIGLYVSDWDLLRSDRVDADMTLLVERIATLSRLLWAVRRDDSF